MRQDKARLAAGSLLVALVVANATAQAEYDQWVYRRLDFSSYYLLCYFSSVWTAALFPLLVAADLAWWHARGPGGGWRAYRLGRLGPRLAASPGYSARAYWRAAVPLGVLNFTGTYLWYMSLDRVPVSVNSPLFRSSAMLLVFALSLVFLGERATRAKAAAVALCVAGVALTAYGNYRWPVGGGESGGGGDAGTAAGYALVLGGAALWALYEIVFRRLLGRATPHGVTLLVSMQGVVAGTLLWPGLALVAAAGLEPWPDLGDPRVWSFLFANAAFAVTYYLFYDLGMAVTSPLFMTVAGTLGVPAAAAADAALHGSRYSAVSVAGMAAVVLGVAAMSLGSRDGKGGGHGEKERGPEAGGRQPLLPVAAAGRGAAAAARDSAVV